MTKEITETKCLLSIVVPVYNTEKYVAICLDSLLDQDVEKQTYEIICINDGSTDGSFSILQNYAERYENIRLIDKPNSGVSATRNLGIEVAQGQYVWFIDSDDWVARNCLSVINDEIEKQHPSIVQISYDYIIAEWRIKQCEKISLKTEQVERCVYELSAMSYVGACSSIINKELLTRYEHTFFEDLYYGEDILFMREFFDRMRLESEKTGVAHKVVHCKGDVFYYYRQHDSSAMHTSWTKNRVKYMDALLKMAQINQERMKDTSKPRWYNEQYRKLFYDRMFNYMVHWLPGECNNLKERLKYLKQQNLYPCAKPPKEVRREWMKANSIVEKMKCLYRYAAFRWKLAYYIYYNHMTRKQQMTTKNVNK